MVIPDHAMGLPVLRALSFMYVLPMFRLGVVVAIVGATAFLIWLARV